MAGRFISRIANGDLLTPGLPPVIARPFSICGKTDCASRISRGRAICGCARLHLKTAFSAPCGPTGNPSSYGVKIAAWWPCEWGRCARNRPCCAPLFLWRVKTWPGVLAIARGPGSEDFLTGDFQIFKAISEQSAFALHTATIFSEAAVEKTGSTRIAGGPRDPAHPAAAQCAGNRRVSIAEIHVARPAGQLVTITTTSKSMDIHWSRANSRGRNVTRSVSSWRRWRCWGVATVGTGSRYRGYRGFATKVWNASRFAEMNGCVRVVGFGPRRRPLRAQSLDLWRGAQGGRADQRGDRGRSRLKSRRRERRLSDIVQFSATGISELAKPRCCKEAEGPARAEDTGDDRLC